MPSTFFFLLGTLLLSLNFIRPFGLALSDWMCFVAIIFAIIETITIDKENFIPWIKNDLVIFAYLILIGGLISLANSKNIKIGLSEIVQQLYVITIYISLIGIMIRRGKTKEIVLAIIISGAFSASVAIIDFFTGSKIGLLLSGTPNAQYWGRYAGTLGHPNKFGYFLVITSILSLTFLLDSKKVFLKTILLFLLFVQIFGIYLSGSVTAYIGFVSAVLLILITNPTLRSKIPKNSTKQIVGMFVLILAGILLSISNANVFDSVISFITKNIMRVQTTTAYSRMHVYKQALNMIFQSPLIGIGYDQVSTSGLGFDKRLDVHNVLLQTWFVGGLWSFIGLFCIYCKLGWNSLFFLRNYKKNNYPTILIGLAATTLAIIIMDQFQDAIYQREKWLIFGIFSVYVWMEKKAIIKNGT